MRTLGGDARCAAAVSGTRQRSAVRLQSDCLTTGWSNTPGYQCRFRTGTSEQPSGSSDQSRQSELSEPPPLWRHISLDNSQLEATGLRLREGGSPGGGANEPTILGLQSHNAAEAGRTRSEQVQKLSSRRLGMAGLAAASSSSDGLDPSVAGNSSSGAAGAAGGAAGGRPDIGRASAPSGSWGAPASRPALPPPLLGGYTAMVAAAQRIAELDATGGGRRPGPLQSFGGGGGGGRLSTSRFPAHGGGPAGPPAASAPRRVSADAGGGAWTSPAAAAQQQSHLEQGQLAMSAPSGWAASVPHPAARPKTAAANGGAAGSLASSSGSAELPPLRILVAEDNQVCAASGCWHNTFDCAFAGALMIGQHS